MEHDRENAVTLALGTAVVRQWGQLPQEIQEALFESAAEAATELQNLTREELAIFLHDRHPRTEADAKDAGLDARRPF